MKVRVRTGDSLWYYSQLFMLPVNLIIDSNPTVDYWQLKVGQEIVIPGFTTQAYQVKKGDTFWKLSVSRNISVDALVLLNQADNPNKLMIGASVLLPTRVVNPVVYGKTNYSFSTLSRDIKELSEIYPFINVRSVGQSVMGQPLTEIRLGKGDRKVHINASFHANEWITTPILMTFLNAYLLSLTNGEPIRGLRMMPFYNSLVLSIVPMVNPDGVDLVLNGPPASVRSKVVEINNGSIDFTAWKANIRGVDLNNQYPANWEIEKERKEPKSPAPRDYPGDAPLTEPEAIAMANLAKQSRFDSLIALHTQGEEFYWGYEGLEPPESERMATEFARVSGYQSIRNVDSHAGYKDWFIQEYRRPGFTIELGKGINPLPLSQFDEIYKKVLGIFIAALYM
jgi:g-D-glutamyl-meso-diaminopimelate peptidase